MQSHHLVKSDIVKFSIDSSIAALMLKIIHLNIINRSLMLISFYSYGKLIFEKEHMYVSDKLETRNKLDQKVTLFEKGNSSTTDHCCSMFSNNWG